MQERKHQARHARLSLRFFDLETAVLLHRVVDRLPDVRGARARHPGSLHLGQALGRGLFVRREVDVDQFEEELGRVDVQGDPMAQGLVVRGHIVHRTEVVRLAGREQKKLVEEVEG
jgi:hypothetical protein